MDASEKDCCDCAHAACDPDGLYCVEEHSMKNSNGYGRNLHVARLEDCGKKAIFFVEASADILLARGRYKEPSLIEETQRGSRPYTPEELRRMEKQRGGFAHFLDDDFLPW